MKLIIYENQEIHTIENIEGILSYTAEEITVVKKDGYTKTETRLETRNLNIMPDSDACVALEAIGVNCEPLYDQILSEYL